MSIVPSPHDNDEPHYLLDQPYEETLHHHEQQEEPSQHSKQQQQHHHHMNILYTDVLRVIFQYLPIRDLAQSIPLVHSQWNEAVEDDMIWEDKLRCIAPDEYLDCVNEGRCNWRESFLECIRFGPKVDGGLNRNLEDYIQQGIFWVLLLPLNRRTFWKHLLENMIIIDPSNSGNVVKYSIRFMHKPTMKDLKVEYSIIGSGAFRVIPLQGVSCGAVGWTYTVICRNVGERKITQAGNVELNAYLLRPLAVEFHEWFVFLTILVHIARTVISPNNRKDQSILNFWEELDGRDWMVQAMTSKIWTHF